MKHNPTVTVFLVSLFLTAQAVGLYLLNLSIDTIETTEAGTAVNFTETITPRPELEGSQSFTYTILMILIGTGLLLLLIKFRLFKVWKAWFYLAIFGALLISFDVFLVQWVAVIMAAALAYLKLKRPNVFVHNFTEVFMYAGILILLAPLFDVFWMALLLVAISIYDIIAVFKSKHMITLATAQADEKMFAGLMIPYTKAKISKINLKIPTFKEKKVKSAILGGGDIAFPMLYAGTVMVFLIENGISTLGAYFQSLLISVFAGLALLFLLIKSKKNKFYPAMPFISFGCFIGYGIILLLNLRQLHLLP